MVLAAVPLLGLHIGQSGVATLPANLPSKQGYLTREAVAGGVASTARIITGAALIIVAVFAGFARGQLLQFQEMGFGVAVALILDATLIRLVILPSTLSLLGQRGWYLPRWLDWLPHLQAEPPPAPPTVDPVAAGAPGAA
jgi:uncharacterized membrane protein YdfJ with MMPL/SSD domain